MTVVRIGSLFTGYGGLDQAAQQLWPGSEPAWFADNAAGPSRLLAHHYPNVPNLGDVTGVPWQMVPGVDVLTMGFPCQDVSVAGRRAGVSEGTRSGLWSVGRDAIAELRPSFVLIENVRGLLSAKADSDMGWAEGLVDDRPDSAKPAQEKDHPLRGMGRVLGDLADLGYDNFWQGLEVADVGGAHRRFRVFIFAWDSTGERVEGLWPEGFGQSEALVEPRLLDGADGGTVRLDRLLPTPRSKSLANGPSRHGDGGMDLQTAVLWNTPAEPLLPTPAVADTQGGRKHRSGARSGELLLNGIAAYERFGEYAAAVESHTELMGCPPPNPVEPNSKGDGVRLSAPFVEWLMCLPSGWVTDPAIGLSRNEQLQLLGNGVVPVQAFAAYQIGLAQYHACRGVALQQQDDEVLF